MSPPDATPPAGPGSGWDAVDRRIAAGPPPAGEAGTPDPRCHVCGTPLEPDQTYCLECGSPTPIAPRLTRPSRGTALVAGALALLALGTGALAFAVAGDDEEASVLTVQTVPTTTTTVPVVPVVPVVPTVPGVGPLPPDTSALPTTPPAGTFPTVTSDTAGQVPTIPPVATAPPAGDADGDGLPDDTAVPGVPGFTPGVVTPVLPVDPDPSVVTPDPDPPVVAPDPDPPPIDSRRSDWPAGRNAWTVQVASVRSRSAAEAIEARLSATGEPAGVLFSSDHPELVPGYFVVFSGVYPDRAQAIAQAASIGPGFPGVFAREISD